MAQIPIVQLPRVKNPWLPRQTQKKIIESQIKKELNFRNGRRQSILKVLNKAKANGTLQVQEVQIIS